MPNLLDRIDSPQDLRLLNVKELQQLANEIRGYITNHVKLRGGHLSSNLGVVELVLALHYIFDFKQDKLFWDTGHQCYTHKIITGRKKKFNQLRQHDGISGFPCPWESTYDQFAVGHAGTSIATAIGMALGLQMLAKKDKIVVFVGDASIFNGLSFEALNNLWLVKRQMLIVLNDNSMAIDITQGALAKLFTKIRLNSTYEDVRRMTETILERIPFVGKNIQSSIERFKKVVRITLSATQFFESLDITYLGPVDGHDIESLIKLFRSLSKLTSPAILHVYTQKGKGFRPAENDPKRFHSIQPSKRSSQIIKDERKGRTFTEAFADTLVDIGRENEKVVAITAAMPDGTGLQQFRQEFPERYYDFGIAESAAVDIAAGLAKQGFKPIVCIYSTFLQRAFDQIFQEVALQNLGVVFCIDRAGMVGPDGPTHHGLMDIGFLRMLPNMTLISPADGVELNSALRFAVNMDSPVAIRYPNDIILPELGNIRVLREPFELGKSVAIIQEGCDIVLVSYGYALSEVIKAAKILKSENIAIDVINARFAKPIDEKIISQIANGKCIVTVEDHYLACGFGASLLELTNTELGNNLGVLPNQGAIVCLGASDRFFNHGDRDVQLEKAGITCKKIISVVKNIKKSMNQRTKINDLAYIWRR